MKVTDNILGGNVLLMRMLNGRGAKAWGDVSGSQLLVPIKYQSSTSGGWYSGFDTFSTTQMNTRTMATFTPKQLYWSVVISGIQQAVNQGPQRVLDLLAVEMNSVADDMTDTLGTGLIKIIANIAQYKSSLIRRIKELLTSISLKIQYEAI